MLEEQDLLEPRKAYERIKGEHIENATKYFDKLAEVAETDIEANAITVRKYYETMDQIKDADKIRSKKKSQRGAFIFLTILAIITAIVMGVMIGLKTIPIWAAILSIVACVALAVFLIVYIVKKINPIIKKQNEVIARLQKQADALKAEAFEQMRTLNNSYDWNMQVDVLNETVPLFHMDKYFDVEKYTYLNQKFGLGEEDEHHSTLYVQSGNILGNPYLIEKGRVQYMGTKTYEGHLTITYTVRVPNGKGGYTTSTVTQTLTAHVTKPCPYYDLRTSLIYGCEAAPKLQFSRSPTFKSGSNEKETKKFIEHGSKQIEKKAIKEISKTFTPIGNMEFETMFNALNRNDEMQFRLLFTPLAQRNMCDLIKQKEPYGDDFVFIKDRMLNLIRTKHSQNFDYSGDPDMFIDFDYNKARKKFIDYNDAFLRNFYFDMAPLMCIPLYHQYPTDEYIFEKKFAYNVTSYETESIANSFNPDRFMPENCATQLILKSKFVKTHGKADLVNITAHGFRTVEHIDYVNVLGGDGKLHAVPVHWLEYIAVQKTTPMEVQYQPIARPKLLSNKNSSEFSSFIQKYVQDNAIIYGRGVFGFIPSGNSQYNSAELEQTINKFNK